MTNYQGILICGEVLDGKIAIMTKELISAGKKLGVDLHQPLAVLFIGRAIHEIAEEAISLGAEKVFISDSVSIVESHPEYYLSIIFGVCRQINPSIILLGQTDIGRDIAPRLAAKLGASICMDCIDLAIDLESKSLLQTKPVYGGNAVAVWASASDQPRIVTLRPRVVASAEADTSRQGEIVQVSSDLNNAMIRSKLLETAKEEIKGIRLEEARVIVAGGGGIGSQEGFHLIQELAQVLGGTVGVSRVPCDEGWMPVTVEIGQTGHIVSPDLYIAVGVSGAMQHMAGCSGAKYIVAINKDSEAHIFKEANFGVIADYRQVLPALIDKLKTLLNV